MKSMVQTCSGMTALYFSYLTDGFDLVDLTLDSKELVSVK